MTSYPTIDRTAGDAEGFIASVDRIVAGLVFRYRPVLVCLVRIRRWFDHRWLGFSGYGRVPFDSPSSSDPGVSLDEFHQDQLTFPPFAPSRVVGEVHWTRGDDGSHAKSPARFRVHRTERRHSSSNLQRRVADVVESGLFVWFSSASAANGRGSVLVYAVNGGATFPWFAALRCERSACTLAEVKGLGRPEIEELLRHPPGPRAARPVQLSEA